MPNGNTQVPLDISIAERKSAAVNSSQCVDKCAEAPAAGLCAKAGHASAAAKPHNITNNEDSRIMEFSAPILHESRRGGKA
jgi:hypothetical protein